MDIQERRIIAKKNVERALRSEFYCATTDVGSEHDIRLQELSRQNLLCSECEKKSHTIPSDNPIVLWFGVDMMPSTCEHCGAKLPNLKWYDLYA